MHVLAGFGCSFRPCFVTADRCAQRQACSRKTLRGQGSWFGCCRPVLTTDLQTQGTPNRTPPLQHIIRLCTCARPAAALRADTCARGESSFTPIFPEPELLAPHPPRPTRRSLRPVSFPGASTTGCWLRVSASCSRRRRRCDSPARARTPTRFFRMGVRHRVARP